jgi:putative SOS response-associated peptidase YedK
MCKRLVIPEQEDAEKEISVAQPWWKFTVRFNVAVKHRVPVARLHNKMTEGVMMQWGFVPSPERQQQQQEISVGAALVPSDAVLTSEDYRRAWLYGQRCVIPLAGFYAWHRSTDGVSRPSYVRLVNRAVFGVAGLWERTVLDEGEDVIESCALLTVPANRLIAEIDDDQQMPAILHRRLRRMAHFDGIEGTVTAANLSPRAHGDAPCWSARELPRIRRCRADPPGGLSRLFDWLPMRRCARPKPCTNDAGASSGSLHGLLK